LRCAALRSARRTSPFGYHLHQCVALCALRCDPAGVFVLFSFFFNVLRVAFFCSLAFFVTCPSPPRLSPSNTQTFSPTFPFLLADWSYGLPAPLDTTTESEGRSFGFFFKPYSPRALNLSPSVRVSPLPNFPLLFGRGGCSSSPLGHSLSGQFFFLFFSPPAIHRSSLLYFARDQNRFPQPIGTPFVFYSTLTLLWGRSAMVFFLHFFPTFFAGDQPGQLGLVNLFPPVENRLKVQVIINMLTFRDAQPFFG